MSDYKGDFAEDATVTFFFNTVDTDGAPITIGGTAAVEVYKDGGTTQSSAGVTVTEDFDSITGLHKVVVDMSSDAFYASGADFSAVISVGTADSVSVVGGVVAEWSCENRTTTQNTLFANVVQISDDSAAAINLESYCDGTTPQPVNVTTWLGTAAATPSVAGVPEVDITHIGGSAASTAANVDVSTTSINAIADQVLDEALSGHTTAGTLGKAVADIETDATAILEDTATTIPATIATVDSNVDAILVDTGTTIPGTLSTIDGKVDTVDTNVDSVLVDTGTTLPATLATIDGNVDSILTDTGTTLPAAISGLNDPTAAAISTQIQSDLATEIARIDEAISASKSLTSGERDAVAAAILDLANGVETSWTLRQAMRIVLSAAAAKVSGMDDNAPVFRDVGDTKDRITATTDADGNRSAVTLDAS